MQEIFGFTFPKKTYGDAPFHLTATSTSGNAVTYASSDSSVAKISGNTVTIAGAGVAQITASVAGRGNFVSASTTLRLTVAKAIPTITLPSIPKKFVTDPPFNANANTNGTDTAGKPLALTYASSDPDVASVNAEGTITIKKLGTCTITVSQGGGRNYKKASASQRLTVLKVQEIVGFVLSKKTYGDAPFHLTATSTSGEHVTYTSRFFSSKN